MLPGGYDMASLPCVNRGLKVWARLGGVLGLGGLNRSWPEWVTNTIRGMEGRGGDVGG